MNKRVNVLTSFSLLTILLSNIIIPGRKRIIILAPSSSSINVEFSCQNITSINLYIILFSFHIVLTHGHIIRE